MQARDYMTVFLMGEPPRTTLRVSSCRDALADLQNAADHYDRDH